MFCVSLTVWDILEGTKLIVQCRIHNITILPIVSFFILQYSSREYELTKRSKRHRLLESKGEHKPLLTTPVPPLSKSKSRPITPDQESSGTSTPPFEVLSSSNSVVPLYLTQRQEGMVRNLNMAIPKMERIVAWFPFAFNSHATLIMR